MASRRLVVDTSIARTAGGLHARHLKAQRSRDFLNAVRDADHYILLTGAIAEEWNRHQAPFSRTWRASMMARKRVLRLIVPEDEALRRQIDATAKGRYQREAMSKDAMLLEAAIASDRTVASLDDEVRRLFAHAAETVQTIRSIVWVNPDREEEMPLDWVREGAMPERKRRLGYRPGRDA